MFKRSFEDCSRRRSRICQPAAADPPAPITTSATEKTANLVRRPMAPRERQIRVQARVTQLALTLENPSSRVGPCWVLAPPTGRSVPRTGPVGDTTPVPMVSRTLSGYRLRVQAQPERHETTIPGLGRTPRPVHISIDRGFIMRTWGIPSSRKMSPAPSTT